MTHTIISNSGRVFTLAGPLPFYLTPATASALLHKSRARRRQHLVERELSAMRARRQSLEVAALRKWVADLPDNAADLCK